jgi:predicted DNA-binding protein
MCAQQAQSSSPAPAPKKTVFFNIRLDPEMHRELKERAEANERTIAGEIRAAVRRHLDDTRLPEEV